MTDQELRIKSLELDISINDINLSDFIYKYMNLAKTS